MELVQMFIFLLCAIELCKLWLMFDLRTCLLMWDVAGLAGRKGAGESFRAGLSAWICTSCGRCGRCCCCCVCWQCPVLWLATCDICVATGFAQVTQVT